MIVIDGIADLLKSVNDEEASVDLVDELFRLAGIYKTCIVCVLHMTSSGQKLRGHLGSEIQRKAAGILSIEKEENSNISIVKAVKVREGSPMKVPLIQFGWDEEKNCHIYLGEKSRTSIDHKKYYDYSGFVENLFKIHSSITYSNLMRELMAYYSVKERMAKNHIKAIKELGLIKKQNENSDEFIKF